MADSTLIHGRYQLLEQIGRGGMGQVWRARDEALGREVAVKYLKPLAGQEEMQGAAGVRERFRREARVAAGLQHRGITVVHDFGEFEGVLYLVMEFLGGRNLSEVLSERSAEPLPEAEVADIADQTAAALAYTHGRGVVHRDLKPANLMLLDDGTVKICDFGIARLVDGISLGAKLTTAGMAMGTPHYMSPEQITGIGVDARSDLYSLGCVLYELATGAPPFDLGDPWAILVGHRDTAPLPLRDHRPDLSAGLEDLVLGLLAKDPADRPVDAARRARLVARGLRRETAGLAPPSPRQEAVTGQDLDAAPPDDAESGPSSGGAVAAPARSADEPPGSGGDAGASGEEEPDGAPAAADQPGATPPAPDPSEAPAPAAVPAGVVLTVTEAPAPAPPADPVIPPSDPVIPPAAAQPGGAAGQHPAGPPPPEAPAEDGPAPTAVAPPPARRSGGATPATDPPALPPVPPPLPRWARGMRSGPRADDVRAAPAGAPPPLTDWWTGPGATEETGPGADGPSAAVPRGAPDGSAVVGDGLRQTFAGRHSAGLHLARLGRWSEALRVHQQLLAERERALGPDHPDTVESRSEVAGAMARLGRWADALNGHARVADTRGRLLGPRHPDTLAARHEMAVALGRLGRPAAALEVYRELVAARTHSRGRSHPETLRARHGYGVSLGRLGRWEEALAEARDVCALRTASLGADHPQTMVSHREVATALAWLGRWEEALAEYRRVRAHRERDLGHDHPDVLGVVVDETHCLRQLGRHAEAAELDRRVERHQRAGDLPAPPTGS